MITCSRPTRRTLVRSALAGLALVIAIPTAAMAHPFTDVPGGKWFSNAVEWAYDNDITTGVAPDQFGGDQNITRYQAVTMLHRMDTKIIQPGLQDLEDDMSTSFHVVVHGDTGNREPGPSTNGVTAKRYATGEYELDFPADISKCAWQGTLTVAHDGGIEAGQVWQGPGMIGLNPDFDGEGPPDVSGIYVRTYDANGIVADRDFTVSVTCSPKGPLVLSPYPPVLISLP
jgi:hypothetical protein